MIAMSIKSKIRHQVVARPSTALQTPLLAISTKPFASSTLRLFLTRPSTAQRTPLLPNSKKPFARNAPRSFLTDASTAQQTPLFTIPTKPSNVYIATRSFLTDAATYKHMFTAAQNDSALFWREASKGVEWQKNAPHSTPSARILDASNSPHQSWFPDSNINMCYNALDRHIAIRGGQVALLHDSPVTNAVTKYTYSQLLSQVQTFASALKSRGVKKGDRVLIYMPMVPQAVVAILACTRIGAVHSVVFGGFAAAEIAKRIDDAKPAIVVTANYGIEVSKLIFYKPLIDGALQLAEHKIPQGVICVKRDPSIVVNAAVGASDGCNSKLEHAVIEEDYDTVMEGVTDRDVECEEMKGTDPLYLLYTSGTTGAPKGILRDVGGHCVTLNWTMENIMRMKPGGVYWSASDIGWVVGHSYIVFGPLLGGCTSVMYEGKPVGTPDAGAFMRVISEHKVEGLFTAPTAIRGIRKLDPDLSSADKYDISSLKSIFLAGERADPSTVEFLHKKLGPSGIKICDNYWQTESGSPIAGLQIDTIGHKAGSCGLPVPGYNVQILDSETHEPVKAGELGDVVVKSPLPPGALVTVYNDDERFLTSYFDKHEGYYNTGDVGLIDEDGYVHVMTRSEDLINVAGHRLSTGAIEELVSKVPGVAECAVVGAFDELKGMVPVAFVVLVGSSNVDEEQVKVNAIRLVREGIGPVAAFKKEMVFVVASLPKTRSGKVLRNALKAVVDGTEVKLPGTIEYGTEGVIESIRGVVGRRE